MPEIKDVQLLKKSSPLGRISDFVHTTFEGVSCKREIDTMDTFMDSSWYFLRFLDTHNTEQPFCVEKLKKWMPVDIYVGGMEHAIMHLLYARFIHKVLCDVNGVQDQKLREPFKELIV